MKLITATVKMAFMDVDDVTEDTAAENLVNQALDGLGAEVAYTASRSLVQDPTPDLDWDTAGNAEIEAWQAKARAVLDAAPPDVELTIPTYDPEHPAPYPGNIQPGTYGVAGIVSLLRTHRFNPLAVQFIADMLEE